MFFYNDTELKDYIFTNASFDFALIKPKLKQVDDDILKVHFGSDFIDSLQTAYDGTTAGNISTLTAAQQAAIIWMRKISAPLAISLWITPGQLQVSASGIFIATNNERKTAFEWQIKDLIKSYLKPAYQALENAITFFIDNIGDYADYESFEEYTYYKQSFIPNSKVFTKLYSPLKNSFMSFIALRSCMNKADEAIQNVLLNTYYDAFKARMLADTLTAEDEAILPLIRKSVANLTIAIAVGELGASFDENGFMIYDNTSGVKSGESKKTATNENNVSRLAYGFRDSANTYLAQLKAYLEKNKANYSQYTSDPDYVADMPANITNEDTQDYFIAM